MFDEMDAKECFREWPVLMDVDLETLHMFLAVMAKKVTEFVLPMDGRTLLGTNRKATGISEVSGGKLWYNGLRYCLETRFKDEDMSSVSKLKLNVGSISESSTAVLGPLIISVHDMPHVKPMYVSVFPSSMRRMWLPTKE
ncbi:hypothetical protein ZHAS_00005688 [Anopheles sinensis]|uniref:Uncharacterized protein n=1 Tax=Anopheles sinensis TaxID=74873 RepID=A0A084VK36_ANOSI|nr:hypothetical protein ZHAS_00005688 [Anopheles sinensis]